MARSWLTIRLCSSSSMRSSFADSSSLSEVIGMPVQREITSSMSSRVTTGKCCGCEVVDSRRVASLSSSSCSFCLNIFARS